MSRSETPLRARAEAAFSRFKSLRPAEQAEVATGLLAWICGMATVMPSDPEGRIGRVLVNISEHMDSIATATPCPRCEGVGQAMSHGEEARPRACPTCGGSGQRADPPARATVEPMAEGWCVIQAGKMLHLFGSEAPARVAADALNRGPAESVSPKGRWA